MAQQCPASVDVTDIQFKLQSKHKVFNDNGKLRDHINLLACASNHGLLFVGNPNAPEMHALILPDVIYAKSKGQQVHYRTTKLANVPNTIACNADGSMLAVNYTVQGYGVLEMYHVPSFATSDIKILYSIRLPDQNVYALQLLWNPVLPAVIGVLLSNGSFVLYTLKDGGAMEMRSIKNQQIQCGCWSPKGKQIVLGHPNGKLQQFKPDLTPAKIIICPPDVHPGPFDTISLHWLSTFQFVVSFLQHGEGTLPNMYIVNAPKGGTPVYINYNDVCYSGSEPRKQQITFMHIAQWNLLLVTSANGVEIGLLGTKDSSDQPQWVHYMLLDEARIEMPLTEASDETYPIGLALDTSPTHELTVGERKLQTMPVIHVLSTNGHLLCFNFLNLTPSALNICSPPASKNYAIAKFSRLDEKSLTKSNSAQSVEESSEHSPLPTIETPPPPPPFHTPPPQSNIQTNVTNQSIPASAAPANKALFSAGWEQKPQSLSFGVVTTSNDTQRNLITKPTAHTSVAAVTSKPAQPTEVFKPLYTVSPEFAPPSIQQQQMQQKSQQAQDTAGKSKSQLLNLNETNSVIQQMIFMQIAALEKEIKQLGQKSKLVLNDDVSTMKGYSKRLINLQEIIEQANERDFIMDVQDLRNSLTESYEMLNECRSKLEMYKNPDEVGIKYLTLYDCISQRQLKGLQNYLVINQSMMKNLEQQIDSQWSCYQDMVRRNSKYHMRIPCLDGIYQQMTKLKNLITQQQTKLHYIKSIIKQRELGCGRLSNDWRKDGTQSFKSDGAMMSLADSILSMSINNMTDAKSNKLSENKLNALRNFTRQQGKITIIKPQRPNRVELTSEVILETKQLIKRKEIQDKASKAVEKEKSNPTLKPKQPQPKQMTETQFQNQFRHLPPQQRHHQPIPATTPFGSLQQNFQLPKDVTQRQSPPQTTLFSGANIFAGTKSGERPPELLKFGTNTNTAKTDVADVKPNMVSTSNKAQFSKNQAEEKAPSGPAANFSFTAKSDGAEMAKSAQSNIFNVASKGFVGFGQPTVNAINIFNPQSNNTVDQPNPIQKTFSFGNTFNSPTDLNIAAKADTAQKPTGLPIAISSTTMQPNVFNKQHEQKNVGPFADTSLEKNASEDTQAQKGYTQANPTYVEPAHISSTSNSDTMQNQRTADDIVLKSLNICKPTAKEAEKPKEENVFSFTSNDENNPRGAFQSMSESKGSTVAATTTASSPLPFCGKGVTTSTAQFSPFGATSINVPAFGSTAVSSSNSLTSSTTTATPITMSTTVSLSGSGVGTPAFSFSNSTIFKQVPSSQNQAPSNTADSANSVNATVKAETTTSTATSSTSSTSAPTPAAVISTGAATPTAEAATPTAAAATPALTPKAVEATPSPTAATAVPSTASAEPTSNTTSPLFSTIDATKAPGDSLFGNSSQQPTLAVKSDNVTQPITTNEAAFGSMSLGSTAPPSGGNIFGNAGSGFACPPGGIFGGGATGVIPTSPNSSAGSIFGNTAAKMGNATTSIFASAANIKPAENTSGSIFGNVAAKSGENSGGSLFAGVAAAKPPENVNIFGSPTSTAAGGGGSIFGQSALGQSSGSIFAAAVAASKPETTSPTAAGFSFVGSAFGSAAKPTVAPGGSIFGSAGSAGDAHQQQQSNVFGSPASGFGAPATSPFSSFSQGATSVASTGFGSPTQQPQAGGAFSRPVFGSAPTFGSPPAFGAQPSFGGAPSFGSPKGFGSFTTPTAGSFGSPTAQGSNIFEALGSADTGLSFGNLAQTTNNPTNAPKPMFGGSSFMNYRA
ncbi:nuclear pore complex protein Nup214 isoform X2 [Eurosta solidaginis]|uniref:nuclear pore complex protein Nup214 isoform X2 n=1 Tax=Eurosta solidaginis TaxID=178769 RepID=UPI003531300D